jgi:CRP/FNR family nitrogen fixation transcriptional regulator
MTRELPMSFSGQVVLKTSQFSPAAVVQPFFRNDRRDGLAALDTLGSVCRFRRGETIFGEGDALRSSYKIVSGAVRLSRITEDGRRQIVEFRVAGEFVGFEWDGEYALGAEAVRDVVAIRYIRTRVDHLMEERSDVRACVVGLIRKELRAAHEHLITLGCPGAKERVANFLLQLAQRSGAKDGDTIEIELGRQDMADYLGMTLETISRTLSEFKRTGAIALPKRRQIVVLSKAKLRAQSITIN